MNLKIKDRTLINNFLSKKVLLIFLAFVLTTFFSIQISNLFQIKNEGFYNSCLELFAGFTIFTILYFIFTKFLKVNSIKIQL